MKVTKKDIQEARRPDAVLEQATSLFDWILAHRNLVLGVLGAIIVVGVAAALIQSQSESKQREVGGQLSQALELAGRPVVEKTGDAAPDEKSFPSKEAKAKAVEDALAAVAKDHPGTEAARAAELKLAQVRLEAGRTDDAIAGFEKYLSEVKEGGLRLFALESLAYAYETKGDKQKAADTFQKLGDAGAPGRALYHRARLAELGGNKDEARKLYEQVIKDYEKEGVAGEARSRLELLDAPPPGTGAITAPPAEPAPAPEQPGKKPAKKKTSAGK